ncbi:MAG: DUF805 domain-containing protein [Campylobacteraceae bacterium]
MEAFNTYFVDVIKNRYVDFNGRATRRQYWMFVLFNLIVQVVVGFVAGLIAGIFNAPTLSMIILVILCLALLLPSLSIAVRRLHDTNKTGWLLLLCLIPIVSLVLIYFFVIPSDEGSNKYGEPSV